MMAHQIFPATLHRRRCCDWLSAQSRSEEASAWPCLADFRKRLARGGNVLDLGCCSFRFD